MRNALRRLIPLLAGCSLLAACATTAPPPPGATLALSEREARWQNQKPLLESINHWRIRGKIGVKTGKKGGSATLKWR